jgi:hypothetical protein
MTATSSSSSTSATARSSATCTQRSPRPSGATTSSASPARRSSPPMPAREGTSQLRTTEQAFGDKLHTYTIVDAITDKNVLPFRIDYVNTIKLPPGVDRQAGVGHRPGEGAARAGAHQAGRRVHARALRPEDQAVRDVCPWRAAGQRFQRSLRHELDRGGRIYYNAFGRGSSRSGRGPASQGRAHLFVCRERGRRRTTSSTKRASRPTSCPPVRPRLPRGRDPGLQRDVRDELRHLGGALPELLQGHLADG